MKRHGNLWNKITDIDNLRYAHSQAKLGKSYYREVKMVDSNTDMYLRKIQNILINKTFTTSEYEVEEIFDGRKIRIIHKLPYFPDRIVQHALLNVIGDILTKSFIRDTFQSIRGRGTTDAMKRVKKLVRDSEETPPLALKIDIHKYYPSVNNDKLKAMIRKKIKCPDTLWLIDDIIDSVSGLPIGNYTSQHFGNVYLNQFDWAMKQQIKPLGYFRYCDDIVIFGKSEKELLKIKERAEEMLTDLNLRIKPNWKIYDVKREGVDFVGFIFKPEKTKVRESIASNFRKKCKKQRQLKSSRKSGFEKYSCDDSSTEINSLMAYKGWFKRCNAKQLWRFHTKSLMHLYPKRMLRKIV